MKAMRAVAAGLGLLAGACQTGPTTSGPVAFSVEEAAFIRKPGKGEITGHAFRTRPNGVVVNAAGEVIRLVPVTAYSKERFTRLYGDRKFLSANYYPSGQQIDPAYAEYTRTVKSEANGRFVFENVPPGQYYITAQVVWGEEILSREGGSMYDTVTLTGQETKPVHVILSGN